MISSPWPSKVWNRPGRPRNQAAASGSWRSTASPVAREVGSDVVEHPVEQHPQAALVGLGDEPVEVGVVAQPRVDPEVVGGVVAVGAGGEHRAQCDPGGAEVDGVVEPVDEPGEPVLVRAGRLVGGEGADEAQRVDLPPDRVAHPVRHELRLDAGVLEFTVEDWSAEDVARLRGIYEPLAESVRDLVDATIRTEADAETVAEVKRDIDAAVARLRERQIDGAFGVRVPPTGESIELGQRGDRDPQRPGPAGGDPPRRIRPVCGPTSTWARPTRARPGTCTAGCRR